jgi:putative transposase
VVWCPKYRRRVLVDAYVERLKQIIAEVCSEREATIEAYPWNWLRSTLKDKSVMRSAYKYRLYPTKKQEQVLFWTLARCRELYNAALSEWKDAYQPYERTQVLVNAETGQVTVATMAANRRVRSVSYSEQKRDLPEIKDLREEYQTIHSQVLQDVLLRLKRAFDGFFRRLEQGQDPGFPRFQGRNRYTSFTYPQAGGFSLTHDNRVCLSKIGSIKLKLHRPMEGTPKTCTIKYEAGQWYAVFSCEVAQDEPRPRVKSEVGIDLGIAHFAALSDGTFIESPRYYRRTQKKLEQLQKTLSRKKRGSHRREKARKAVAKAHRKIANQRRDFHHKQAKKLIQEHQTIVFEELEIANVSKRAKPKQDETGKYLPNGAAAKSGLNKSILDAGWGQFQQIVMHKAACAGRTVLKVSPRYTSQVCSQCGAVRKKSLEERWHSCECGCELDRDTNAAINILRLGRSQRGDAPCVEALAF